MEEAAVTASAAAAVTLDRVRIVGFLLFRLVNEDAPSMFPRASG
jgi:hypothetical protein